MKAKELRSMDDEALKSKLAELQLSLIKDNVQVKTGTQVKSPGALRSTKKAIARVHTILNENNTNKNSKKSNKKSSKKSKSRRQ